MLIWVETLFVVMVLFYFLKYTFTVNQILRGYGLSVFSLIYYHEDSSVNLFISSFFLKEDRFMFYRKTLISIFFLLVIISYYFLKVSLYLLNLK